MSQSFHERKLARTEYYFKYVYGWVLDTCVACNGSGYYDYSYGPGHTIKCSSCNGTGHIRVKGPKAIS